MSHRWDTDIRRCKLNDIELRATESWKIVHTMHQLILSASLDTQRCFASDSGESQASPRHTMYLLIAEWLARESPYRSTLGYLLPSRS